MVGDVDDEQPQRSSWARWREAALGGAGHVPPAAAPVGAVPAPVVEPEEEPAPDLDLQLEWPEGPVPRDASGFESERPAAPAAAPASAPASAPSPAPPRVVEVARPEPVPEPAPAEASTWAEPAVEAPPARVSSAPLLPAMASRLDTLHGGLAALAMRFDALAAATNAFRATTGDRIEECLDAIARTGRAQAKALADQARGTDRALVEMRRAVDDSSDALHDLAAKVNKVGGGADDAAIGALNDELASVRELVAAVLDGLPSSAEGSAFDVPAAITALDRRLESLAADVDTTLASLREELVHLRRRSGGRRGGGEAEAAGLSEADVERLAALVVARLERSFEVVGTPADPPRAAAPEPEPEPEPAPATARRPRRAPVKKAATDEAAATPRRRSPRRSGA